MRVIIDASVLVSAFRTDELSHLDSVAFIKSAIAQERILCAPTILFPEIMSAFARPMRNAHLATQVVTQIRELLLIELFSIDIPLALAAETAAQKLFLRGADSIYAALASRLSEPLVTLDKEMLARPPQGTMSYTPGGWLEKFA
jgi:predicted nucleic acid-binding protein